MLQILLCAVLMAPATAFAGAGDDSLRTPVQALNHQANPADAGGRTDQPGTLRAEMETGAATTSLLQLPEALEILTGAPTPEAGRLTGFPLLRGMNAQRMVVSFDGAPLGHSGLRQGPSAVPVAVIPPGSVGGLDVVRGPLVYEPDAIAGAIHIYPSLGSPQSEAGRRQAPSIAVSQRLSSADRGWSGDLSATGALGHLQYSVGGSGHVLGDLRIGSVGHTGLSLQPNTAVRESAVHTLAVLDSGRRWTIRGGLVASWRGEQPLEDGIGQTLLSRTKTPVTIFEPRRLTLAYASHRVTGLGRIDELESTLWYTGFREARTFRRADWGRTVFDDDGLATVGARARARLRTTGPHTLTILAQAQYEGVSAARWEVRDDGSVWGQRGRFPDGTMSVLATVGVGHEWRLGDDLAVSGGAQLGVRTIHADYGPSLFGLRGEVGLIDRQYTGMSWRADVTKQWRSGWSLSGSISTAFRAPGLDEQAANAFWLSGRDVPNPVLEAERATQIEVGGRYQKGRVRVGASIFRTRYRNLIRRDWFEAGPDGLLRTDDDLFRFTNLAASSVSGGEVEFLAGFGSVFGLDVQTSGCVAVHGWSSDLRTTPAYLAPIVGRVGSRLVRGASWIEPFVRFSSRVSATEYSVVGAVSEDTGAWATLNVRMGAQPTSHLTFALSVENVRDVFYVEHGSYIQAPGRNLIVAASYRF